MMRKRSPYGHQRNNNNRGGGNGQMRRHHRRGPGNNTQYEQGDDEFVSPRLRRHAQVQREKYVNMAIDARRSGDRVQAEYWLQHADHYQRILNLAQEQFSARDNNGGMDEGDEAQGDLPGGDEQAAASANPYPQHRDRDNNQYGAEAAPSGEDEAYEPSYGNPAPAVQQPRRQQRHQHPRQQRHAQPQAEMGGGLEDVLPMPKPERNNDRFDQDEE